MKRNRVFYPFLLTFVSLSLLTSMGNSGLGASANEMNQYETITQISLGGWHSSAVSETGQFFTWGYNGNGQLGDGTGGDRNTPLSITNQLNLSAGETIIQSSFGYNHSSVLTSNNRLLAWGRNDYGQVGDATIDHKYVPVDITTNFNLGSGEKINQISLGSNHSAALTSNNRVFAWGYNQAGQIGNNTTTNLSTPTEITSNFGLIGDEKIEKILLGEFHSAALTSTHRVFFWGMNTVGQLGDGSTTNRIVPTDITSSFNLHVSESVLDLFLGSAHSAALTSENRIFTWGNNASGQLGDGTNQRKSLPTEITSNLNLTSGETITNIALRGGSSLALTSSNRVLVWGENGFGQLGDGTNIGKLLATDITSQFQFTSGETVAQISLGFGHSALLTSDGRFFIWGRNTFGQLGNGTDSDVNVPTIVQIPSPTESVPAAENANWAWWFLLLLLIPIGYFAYRYRQNLSNLFKKKAKQ